MAWLLAAVVTLLVGCTYRVETRATEEPLVLDDGAWLPTDAERSLLLGTHRVAPGVRPEAAQVYRWLSMLLLEADGSFLALERATFFDGDDLDAEPGFRNRRGAYALRQRTDGTRALVLTFARKNDGRGGLAHGRRQRHVRGPSRRREPASRPRRIGTRARRCVRADDEGPFRRVRHPPVIARRSMQGTGAGGPARSRRTAWVRLSACANRTATPRNVWCPVPESNQGHGDFQSPALPTELTGRSKATRTISRFGRSCQAVTRRRAVGKIHGDGCAALRCRRDE